MRNRPFSPLVLLACLLPFLIFCLATGIYSFVAYVPVLYEQLIRNELFPWVPWVVAYHRYGFILCLIPVGLALRPLGRAVRFGFVIPFGLYGLGLAVYPLLPGLQSRFESLLWCLFWFLPPLILGVIQLIGYGRRLDWKRERIEATSRGIFLPAATAAAFVTVLYFIAGALRGGTPSATVFLWSAFQHGFVFSLGAAWLTFALLLGSRYPSPLKGELFAVGSLTVFALALGIRQEVLVAFSYFNPWGFVIGATGAASIVVFLAGLAVRLAEEAGASPDNGLTFLLFPFTQGFPKLGMRAAVAFALLAFLAFGFPEAIYLVDWNFLMQRLSAVLAWVLAFGFCYGLPALRRQKGAGAYLPTLVSLAALFWAGPPSGAVVYWGADPSLQVASSLVRPAPPDVPFYSALRRRVNVTPDYALEANAVRLVDEFKVTAAPKPNLFVFIVDSLRRDYVGAFNPKAAFTPHIDAFAKDSVAFTNAFTQYGGTGLSEPSIWVGGLIPARFYIQPFGPLNSLQKLLEAESYTSFVSLDSILSRILTPWPKLVELDHGIPTQKLDFCQTVTELESKLEQNPKAPFFVYTQTQNLHISLPKPPVDPKESRYHGFFGPYAASLEKVDRCFGQLVAYLKRKGLYDDSVILVASDHGDSLGEEGRYGHSYNLFPEVLKIPLIVHLPKASRDKLRWDTGSLAFLTDLTPTLYYLLGHRPIRATALTGRPLFTESMDEQTPYRRSHYLLSASYGAVFGLLFDEGKSLYLADGVNRREYRFEGDVSREPTADEQRLYRGLIDEDLTRLGRFFPPKGGARLQP